MPIFSGKILTKFNVSVLVAALVCLAPLLSPIPGNKTQSKNAASGSVIGPYITLSTDEHVADKLVAEKLGAAGIKEVLSESSQWFFLNDFSEIRRVPLDEFSDLLLETDPRNDGYAGRLRSVFVRDGRRFFYIPRASLRSSNQAVIEQRVSAALKGTPYSLALSGTYAVNTVNTTLFFVPAALLSLLFSVFVSGSLSGHTGRKRFIPEFTLMTAALLPACSLFARLGPAGLALAAVTLTFFITIREPLKFSFMRARLDGGFSVSRLARVKQVSSKERKALLFMFILFITVCITGRVSISGALSAVFFCCLSAAACFFALTMPRGLHHLRFVPVDIRPRREKARLAVLAALPFTLASVAAIGIPFVTRPSPQTLTRLFAPAQSRGIPAVAADDYERHAAFQKNFSLRKLGGAGNEDAAYTGFETGGDGLLYPASGSTPAGTGMSGGVSVIPPFPLESLIAFLNVEDGGEVVTEGMDVGDTDAGGLIAVALALLLYVPHFLTAQSGNGKKERNTLYISQSVTA